MSNWFGEVGVSFASPMQLNSFELLAHYLYIVVHTCQNLLRFELEEMNL